MFYHSYIRRTERQLFTKPTRFWIFCNKWRNISGITSSLSYNGVTTTDTSDICNSFANRFAGAFTVPVDDQNLLAEATNNTPSDMIDFIIPPIDEVTVVHALNNLKSTTSSGPNHIPAYILKHPTNVVRMCLEWRLICSGNFVIINTVFYNRKILIYSRFKRYCEGKPTA